MLHSVITMGTQLFILLQLFSLVSTSSSSSNRSSTWSIPPFQGALQREDSTALRHLRSSLQVRNFYWPKARDPCLTWRGIQCEEGHVVGIQLSGLKRTLAGMSQPSFAMDSLRQLQFLRYLNASGFKIDGVIPYWFGLLSKLEVLDLSFCSSIQGPIPESLGQLHSLQFLSLAGNNLSGGIPYSFGNLVSLTSMDLSSNRLSSWVPSSLTGLPNLVTLDLSNNALVGLPTLGQGAFSRLQRLSVASNTINDTLPKQLGSLYAIRDLDLSFNMFGGSIPRELGSLGNLTILKMLNNNLTGSIPDTLSRCSELQELDLSFNNLSGLLPTELASLDKIEKMVLSHNQLYGPLPAGMARLKRMTFLGLSGNYLNGTLPDGLTYRAVLDSNCLRNVARQRYRRQCQSFYTARGLTFSGGVGLLPTPTPLVGIRRNTSAGKSKHIGAILGGIFGSLGFIVIIAMAVYAFLLHERKPPVQKSDKVPTSQSGGSMQANPVMNITVNLSCIGEAFSFAQLQRATQDFNPVNLIKAGHTGDLYRGVFYGGLLVVIKRVDITTMKKDFLLSELEFLSKASHTRLVPLLGHCLEREEEKYLVYKYMQYGDLAQALHRKIIPSPPKDILQSLDWITRLKIAIGVAEGLTYLHHECSPPLVHRDIKATSILLDDKFEVRLGSLSEARTQDGGSQPGLIMRFLRRSQTSEQDPDSPVASCAYDVYCFGKVLLELVSGKLGISGSMDPGADTWVENVLPLIDRHEKENFSRVVDPSLIVDDDLLEEVWAVSIIAKMCLNPKPSRRPAIRHVLKALENPQRVVRDENFTASLRRSARSSWNASLFGSWRHSSSETVIPGTLKEEHFQGSLQGDHHSYHRRPGSNEIFPEPLEGVQLQGRMNSS